MSKIEIKPILLKGNVNLPPSKSIAHRAIIAACLSGGTSLVENINFSDDLIATIEGMEALGANITAFRNSLKIKGIKGKSAISNDNTILIDCKESGSTLRFLAPIAAAVGGSFRFTGKGNLGKRPINPYIEIFDNQNIKYSNNANDMDLFISGNLGPGVFKVPGNVSSQFISGLLFALPLLKSESEIRVASPLESKAYVDLTLKILCDFGIQIENRNYESFLIKGNQQYKSRDYFIESDYSQAAFFLCAAALGGNITMRGLTVDSLQGDKEIISLLIKMGADIFWDRNYIKASANVLNGITADASEIPDIIPVLAATATLAKGKTIIKNAGRLRIKECDRLSATVNELNKLGADIKVIGDDIHINGVDELEGGCEVQSYGDHRMAMMLSVIAQRCKEPIVINEYECVSKSYPDFFKDYKALGGIVNEQYVGQ